MMLKPTPQLPDDTPAVRLTTKIRKVLGAAGWKSIGEVRAAPDAMLQSLPNMGANCIALLRRTLDRGE